MTETEYAVRVVLTVRIRDELTNERDAITTALDLVNEDTWKTLESEGFTIEADAALIPEGNS